MDMQYHIGLDDSHGAKIAILPGDPARVPMIAEALDEAEPLAVRREYTSYVGKVGEHKVLVMSTGMGGPSTAIGVEELVKTGVEVFIRLGTCGGMAMQVEPGDLVIAQAAIRSEGTGNQYTPVEYPAVADHGLVEALRHQAERLNYPHHVGVVHCKDSFYAQHSPETMPIATKLELDWQAWIASGALASEMESATLYVVSSIRRVRAVCILNVIWNQERAKAGIEEQDHKSMDRAIKTVVEMIREQGHML